MDIFEFAKEKEKLSEDYYRQLAAKTTSEGLLNILNTLIKEEARHFRTIEDMQKTKAGQIPDSQILVEAKKVFESMKKSAEVFNFDDNEVELYQKARQMEIESEKLYRQYAEQSQDEKQKKLFEKLAAWEFKHYVLLENLCTFVEKPQYFLENAEMCRFDDYAGGVF
jgi:rubrerythrin